MDCPKRRIAARLVNPGLGYGSPGRWAGWRIQRRLSIVEDRVPSAVFDHPDDEAFGTGRTLARHAAEGCQVHLVEAVRGEAGEIATGINTSAFGKAEDAFIEFTQTGKLNFTDLVNSIMADITRLAIRSALSDAFGGGGGGGGIGLGGILSGIFGGGGGGDVASQVDSFSKLAGSGGGFFSGLSSLFGFANGGSFQVAGAGGVDRNVLSVNNRPVARVSRGETVNVSPEGSGGRPVQVIMNIQTPDANSFQRSQDQILARTQTALTRAQRRNT